MSFKKILFGLLTLWLALMGLTFGALFVICLSLYLLWHGLSTSVIIFGGLFLACIILAQVALRHVGKDKSDLPAYESALISEQRSMPLALSSSESRERLKRRKMM
ncbi:MAG TPA: hypothetical protein VF544_08120 [Pyrinomonadaceae bacterium]